MKIVCLSLALLLTHLIFAQTAPLPPSQEGKKSAAPVATQNSTLKTQNSTRAVVVGISDYKANEIPDLKYADRDAEQFAAWLKSPAGGSVPDDNIFLLTNQKATNSAIGLVLYDLPDSCKPGDQVIFYFSGHGDLETKIRNQPGFLLAYDSPSKAYATNSLDLRHLGDIVSTLLDNQVRVILITDACHSGKLAGSDTGGSQATAMALQQQFGNTVKIMSCQPNEYSIEGEQWDDGRGVFSFHLVEGLTGLADRDADGAVNLFEIGRYLEDHVPTDAAPHPQMPLTVGDRNVRLATVDAVALATLRQRKAGTKTQMNEVVTKGLEDEVLARADTLTRARYRAFQRALAGHNLLNESDSSANILFGHLMTAEVLKPLHGVLRRNFAVALLDEVQEALNALLDNDPYEANAWTFNTAKYAEYPRYLQRSMDLLGENHYMYRTLKAKKHYFEGYNLAKNLGDLENEPARRDSFKLAAKSEFLQAIQLEPEAAYPYQAIANLYFQNNPYQLDSVVWWNSQAAEFAPNWLAPYLEIAYEYVSGQANPKQAEMWLQKAVARSPDSYQVLERLSWLRQWQGRADESIAINRQMIALKPDIFNAYSTLSTTLTYMKGAYIESEKYCLKSIELEPNQWWWALWNLGLNYNRTRRAGQAVELGKSCLDNPKTNLLDKSSHLITSTQALVQLGRYTEAERYFRLADSMGVSDPFRHTWIRLNEGRMYFQQGNLERAEKTLEAALLLDPTDDAVWITIWVLLADIKAVQGQPEAAEVLHRKALAHRKNLLDENIFRDEAFFRYGCFLLAQNRPVEAEAQFREIGRILPKSYFYGYGMALLAAGRGKHSEALDWLEKSLDNFWPEAGSIRAEPLFKKIRKTKRFEALLAKHFPEGGK